MLLLVFFSTAEATMLFLKKTLHAALHVPESRPVLTTINCT